MTEERDLTGENPLVECALPLGRPGLVVHNELVLEGWAASPVGISGVAVQIGERQWNAAYGLDTPTLARRLPGIAGADRAGYSLAIDTSRWEPGVQAVTVAAFDREGGRSAVEGPVEVRPFPPSAPERPPGLADLEREHVVLSLDSPAIEGGVADVHGPLYVSGWAHAEEGVEAVLVTLDGALQYEALRPIARPDLLQQLGRDVASDAGFVLRIDPVDCAPGRHRLTVSALSRDGRAAGVDCELRCGEAGSEASARASIAGQPDGAQLPRLRTEQAASDTERMWESRALLAEADAALSRAEAQFARRAEERARLELRRATQRPS